MRESHNHSREYLSQNVDIDPQSIYRLEKGEQWIAPEKLEAIAKFYRVSPAVFFKDGGDQDPVIEHAISTLTQLVKELKVRK